MPPTSEQAEAAKEEPRLTTNQIGYVLDQLDAEVQPITVARGSTHEIKAQVRLKRNGHVIAEAFGVDNGEAIDRAVKKAQGLKGVASGPVTRDQKTEQRLLALESGLSAVIDGQKAILEALGRQGSSAPAANASTAPAKVVAPGEFTDEQLRAKLADAGVTVDGRWSRKRLLAEANDRGLLTAKRADATPPAEDDESEGDDNSPD